MHWILKTYIQGTCKHLQPVQVRCSKYPLLFNWPENTFPTCKPAFSLNWQSILTIAFETPKSVAFQWNSLTCYPPTPPTPAFFLTVYLAASVAIWLSQFHNFWQWHSWLWLPFLQQSPLYLLLSLTCLFFMETTMAQPQFRSELFQWKTKHQWRKQVQK